MNHEEHITDVADGRALIKQMGANAKTAVERAMIAALFAIFNRMVGRVASLSAKAERSQPTSQGG